mgnify:CR=1 FL=1
MCHHKQSVDRFNNSEAAVRRNRHIKIIIGGCQQVGTQCAGAHWICPDTAIFVKLFRSNHTDHTDLWVFLKDCKCILKEVLIKD